MRSFCFAGLFLCLCFVNPLFGQLTPNYFTNFDTPSDTVGWHHYAISGSDDWEWGEPDVNLMPQAYSLPYAWVTNLNGNFTTHSNMALETPSFDFSNTEVPLSLSFYQQRSGLLGNFRLEYSTDSGETWQLLSSIGLQNQNWQTASGFSASFTQGFQRSAIELSFLQGEPEVSFRFRLSSTHSSGQGWLIDDFRVGEEYYNIHAVPGDTIVVSQHCPDFDVVADFDFYSQYGEPLYMTTRYYFSYDDIFDPSDTLIGIAQGGAGWSTSQIAATIDMLPNLEVGEYHVFFEYDANNVFIENDETDNVSYAVLIVDSILDLPYSDDFELTQDLWEPKETASTQLLLWELGEGYSHHLEGSYSGTHAWHTSKAVGHENVNCMNCNLQYLESPYFDISSGTGDLVFNLWFKNNMSINQYALQRTTNCGETWSNLYVFPPCRDDEWDFANIPLSSLSANNNVKFRVFYNASYSDSEGIIIDDLYIGPSKPDLSIERDLSNRYITTTNPTVTLDYYLFNSGGVDAGESVTRFYWSTDDVLDDDDLFLGTKVEQVLTDTARVWTDFSFPKPTNALGTYYVFYEVDSEQQIDEIRETNNTGMFTLYQYEPVGIPYQNTFETDVTGWRHNSSLGADDWEWAIPGGTVLDTAFSGEMAWITNATGVVSPMSRMHLYTPVFDFSETVNPVIEFDMKLDSDGFCACWEAKMNMSYSIDGGTTWTVLDTTSQSFNRWYYRIEYANGVDYIGNLPYYSSILFDLNELTFAPTSDYNGRDATRNTRYILDVGFLAGAEQVQFRYNIAAQLNDSGPPHAPREGALIDNFTIREAFIDMQVDYKMSLMFSSLSPQVRFYMSVKNHGNYITAPSTTNYYLSVDTLLDGSDHLLGAVEVPAIRPDLAGYTNQIYDAPENLAEYNYLIYELDANNTNVESNELNNVSYWPLAMDSIQNYPYFNNFNDTIVDGWYQYSIGPYNVDMNNMRFRTVLAPQEPEFGFYYASGQWFTEPRTNSDQSIWFLYSPAFNFAGLDSIFISFDFYCISTNSAGANLDFSTDGGNTWTVLTTSYGEAENWYNTSSMSGFYSQPGWINPAGFITPWFDASFLKGQENVVFRFKYRGGVSPFMLGNTHGMRMDNWGTEAFPAEYIANDSMVNVTTNILQPALNLPYSITNAGQTNGRPTETHFYWSLDSIFDPSDSFIHSISESYIPMGSTHAATAEIDMPAEILQDEYFVFYTVDSELDMLEIDETNNLGSYRISFAQSPNYFAGIGVDSLFAPNTQNTLDVNYSIINNGPVDGENSATVFYWSTDSLFDAGDFIATSINEVPILEGETLNGTADIPYPSPLMQEIYFLFYEADGDGNIDELDEQDNVGAFKVHFEPVISVGENGAGDVQMYVNANQLVVHLPLQPVDSRFNFSVISANGQLVYRTELMLQQGRNEFALPSQLANGIYVLRLHNLEAEYSLRTPLGS